MKKRIFALLLALSTLILSVLSSCSDEKPATKPPSPEVESEPEDVKNELVNASLSDIIELVRDAVSSGAGLESLADSVRFSGTLPANGTLNIPASGLYLCDGILTFISDKEVSYFGFKNGTLTKITNEAESDVLADLGIKADTNDLLSLLGHAIRISEKHLDLGRIKEEDITEGSDGLFYLSDSYISSTLIGLYVSVGLISEGYNEDNADTAPVALLEELETSAKMLAESTKLKIGFGMKMRRITSVKVDLDAKEIDELTEGALTSARINATLKFNATRDKIAQLKFTGLTTDETFGAAFMSAEYEATYGSTGSPIVIEAKIDSSVERTDIANKKLASGASVTVSGGNSISLEIGYNSRYTVTGGNLLDFSLTSSATPKELLGDDVSSVTSDEREELLEKKQYERAVTVALRKNDVGEGILPVSIKDGSLTAKFSGRFEYGTAAVQYNVPEDIKQRFDA